MDNQTNSIKQQVTVLIEIDSGYVSGTIVGNNYDVGSMKQNVNLLLRIRNQASR